MNREKKVLTEKASYEGYRLKKDARMVGPYTSEPMSGLAFCYLKRRARPSVRLAFLASLRARGRACQQTDECLHRLAGFTLRPGPPRPRELMRAKPRARMRPPGV